MSAAHDVEALLSNLALLKARSSAVRFTSPLAAPREGSLVLDWPGLGDLLPDGGLPRGVIELAAPRALGGSTSVALEAVRAGQARSKDAWCAWIDPEGTLHAPGVAALGVDLARMLVVRPPRSQFGRVAVKVMGAGAFEVVVVDFDAVPEAACGERNHGSEGAVRATGKRKGWAPEVLVRKLALAAESSGATVLLLTDSTRPRALQWPVALRLELSRPTRSTLAVRVAKDRRGRIGMMKTVAFRPLQRPLLRRAG
ncbi:MAG TPA: recombinase A [Polyangiaceae bacterium]|jgi:recombination protein RecA